MAKRTKEELIQAQKAATKGPWGAGADALELLLMQLTRGETAAAIDWLATLAGRQWAESTLRDFDLRRVDDQGRLIAEGAIVLPFVPSTKCLALVAPGQQCQEAATHEGHEVESKRCATHAPERFTPLAGTLISWTGGEHVDDMLARGGAAVTASAKRLLEKRDGLAESAWLAASTLKPGELLVLEADPQGLERGARERVLGMLEKVLAPAGAKAILLEGPVRRESVEHLRRMLREVGYDIIPQIRWEDVASWLAATGSEVRSDGEGGRVQICTGADVLCVLAIASDAVLSRIAEHRGIPVREMRAAVEAHVADRKVPTTRAECLAALGIEEGRAYPGLREHLAEWLDFPLTGEESKARAAASRAFETRVCDACRHRQETCAKCGGQTEKTSFGPTMLSLPVSATRTETVPICQACLGEISKAPIEAWTIRAGRVVSSKAVDPTPVQTDAAADRAAKMRYLAHAVIGRAVESKLSVAETAGMLKAALSPLAPTQEELRQVLEATLREVPQEWALGRIADDNIPPGFVRAWDADEPNTMSKGTDLTLEELDVTLRELVSLVILGVMPPEGEPS